MLRAFLRAPSGLAGLVVIAVLAVVAVIGPILWGDQARVLSVGLANQNPSAQNWLGTDQLGRDILLRLLAGSRLSLLLAFLATVLGAGLGIPAGAGAATLPPRLR